jgi:RNA polymerase sigma-70 factor (ECF subfamily)
MDSTAFIALYRRHASDVLVYFVRRTFDTDAARDLTAETFAVAFEHRHRFRGSGEAAAGAWLFGIARHQLSRYLRRGAAERRAVRRLGVEVPEMSAEEAARLLEDAQAGAVAALGELATDQKRAVWLRVVEDLSYAELAAELGVSEPTARARVSRGLRALAAVLDRGATEGATA